MTPDLLVTSLGVFVGALGVLFTVGAIVAGYLVFRQSGDFRATLDATLKKHRQIIANAVADHRSVVTALVADTRARFELYTARVNQEIASARAELERTTGEQRELLTNRLRDLEAERERIAAIPQATLARSAAVENMGDVEQLPISTATRTDIGWADGRQETQWWTRCPHPTCGVTVSLPEPPGFGAPTIITCPNGHRSAVLY